MAEIKKKIIPPPPQEKREAVTYLYDLENGVYLEDLGFPVERARVVASYDPMAWEKRQALRYLTPKGGTVLKPHLPSPEGKRNVFVPGDPKKGDPNVTGKWELKERPPNGYIDIVTTKQLEMSGFLRSLGEKYLNVYVNVMEGDVKSKEPKTIRFKNITDVEENRTALASIIEEHDYREATLKILRVEKKRLLLESDWVTIRKIENPDYFKEGEYEAWCEYRRELLDFTDNVDIDHVVWPEPPK